MVKPHPIRYVFVILAVLSVCMGMAYLSWWQLSSAEGSEIPNEMHTELSVIATLSPTVESLEPAENVPDTVTPTPGINYQATIEVLAIEQHNQDATATEAARQAANELTQVALDHEQRINEVEYSNAVAMVQHDQDLWLYDQEAAQLQITHQVEMQTAELDNYIWKLEWLAWMELIKVAAWSYIPLLVVIGILTAMFVKIIGGDKTPEVIPDEVRLEVKTANITRFGKLRLDPRKLRWWIENAVNNEQPNLTYEAWSGSGKAFTRNEYDTLLDFMRDENIIAYRDPNNPNMGTMVTVEGREALQEYLRKE